MRIQAEANLSALIESTEDLIWSVDPRLRLITFNHAFKEHFEKNFGGPVAPGMGMRELLPPERAVSWPPLYERALRGEKFRAEITLIDRRILDLSFSPIVVDGQTTGVSVFGKDVTEARVAEMKYRDIFEGALEGFFQTTPEGKLLIANRALAKMLGYDSPAEAIACITDTAHQLWVDPEERARVNRQIDEIGFKQDYECQFKRKDGSPIWVLLNCHCVRNAVGQTVLYEGSIQDISERKQGEETLKKTEANLLALIESTRDLIWAVDLDYRLMVFNRALWEDFKHNFGVEIAVGMCAQELLPPDRAALWTPLYERALAEGAYQTQYSLADGRVLELSLNPILVDGKATGVSVFGKDITERLRSEKQLCDSEAAYRFTFEQRAMGIVHCSFEGVYLRCNSRFAEIIGYPIEEVPGLRLSDVTPPETLEISLQVLRDLSDCANETKHWEKQYKRKDGSLIWARMATSVQRDGEGKALHHISFVEDITAQKLAEAELRESRDFLSEAQRIGDLGCYVLDFASGFWSSTPQLDEVFGIDAEYVRSVAGWAGLIHPDDRERMTAYFESEVCGAGRDFDKEYRIVRASDRAVRWVHGMGRLEFDAQGNPASMRGIIRDITEHKQAEIAVEEREKLFRSITESSPLAYAITSGKQEERIDYLNPAFIQLFGYTQEEIPTVAEWWARAYPDAEYAGWVLAEWQRRIPRSFASGSAMEPIETENVCKDGSKKNVLWGHVPLGERNMAYGLDITEQKRAMLALRESEARFRRFFEENGTVMLLLTPTDGEIIDVNQAACEFYGYPREQFIGMHTWQIDNPPPEELARAREKTLNSRCSFFRFQNRRSNGEVMDVEVYSSPFVVDGRTLLFAMVHDVTEHNRASMALAQSEARFRKFFEENSSVMFMVKPESGEIVAANQAAIDFYGYPREQFIGMCTHQISLSSPEETCSDRQRAQRGECACFYYSHRLASGEVRQVELRSSPFDIDDTPLLYGIVNDITERWKAEQQLLASEQRYRATFEQAPVGIVHTSLDGRILRSNERFAEIIGYPRNEVAGLSFQQITAPEDMDITLRTFDRLLRETAATERIEKRYLRKDGSRVWVRISLTARRDNKGTIQYFIAVVEDIHARKMAEQRLIETTEALQRSEERYRTAFQTSIDSININRSSDGLYIDCNQAFLNTLGYEREEVVGKRSLDLNIWVDGRDRQAMVELVRQNSSCRGLEVQFKKKTGEIVWGEMSASAIEIDGEPCILSVTRDISHEKVAETTIRNLAFYDALTSLPNRRYLTEKLSQILASGRVSHSRALLFVELDHFKTLNETLGHLTGDLLLKEIAQRVSACAGEEAIVCRLGGDEFSVMLDDLSESDEEAAAQAQDVGERIRASIGAPCLLDGRECITTASIGCTVFGSGPQSTDELMQEADIALYQAKLAGRNSLRFFSPALQSAVNARATLEEDLRLAIKGNQFLLYYQPQVERGRLIGAEVLIRWIHPKNGMVPPDAFIPLAEETGLILPVGEWVLEAACRQIAEWAGRKEAEHLTVAVNISALQFRQLGFVETVLKALERTGANPRILKLELTESMLVDNIEDVITKMTVLKEHGLSFSLDDFGTGYSSLAYLKRLPLDQLKIDRAFVRDMLVDMTSGAIAQTVISLGRAMGLSVIAEGVENEEQRGFLAGLGCHAFQGTLFSPPLPLEEFEALL